MQFKIKNTVCKISFSFFALILLILTLTDDFSFFLVFLWAVLHELVHLIFITAFSCAPEKITFSVFGADIVRGNKLHTTIEKEFIINLSAPVLNLVIGIFLFYLDNKSSNNIISKSAEANLVLGLFNLLPFYNFDGGNALRCLLNKIIVENITEKILTIMSVITATLFSVVSTYIFFNLNQNPSMIIISVYMFACIIFKK